MNNDMTKNRMNTVSLDISGLKDQNNSVLNGTASTSFRMSTVRNS